MGCWVCRLRNGDYVFWRAICFMEFDLCDVGRWLPRNELAGGDSLLDVVLGSFEQVCTPSKTSIA